MHNSKVAVKSRIVTRRFSKISPSARATFKPILDVDGRPPGESSIWHSQHHVLTWNTNIALTLYTATSYTHTKKKSRTLLRTALQSKRLVWLKTAHCSKQLITFGVMTPRSLAGEHQSFGTPYCLHFQDTLNVKACFNRRVSPRILYTGHNKVYKNRSWGWRLKSRRHTHMHAHTQHFVITPFLNVTKDAKRILTACSKLKLK